MPDLKKRIYFIGRLPLPLGGVTVFNERKVELLRENGRKVIVLEPSLRQLMGFFFMMLDRKAEIILSASNILIFSMLMILPGVAKRVRFYDHNSSRGFIGENWLARIIRAWCLSSFDRIVVVNEHLIKNYSSYKFFKLLEFSVESAFIPPVLSKRSDVVKSYSESLQKRLGAGGRSFVIVSAFRPNLDAHGRDIYGLSEAVDVFSLLCKEFSELNFLIAVAEFGDDEFSARIKERVNRLVKSEKNCFILDGQNSLWPIFENGVIFLRPTTTDGDSVSVREALFFGCAVIASDVVPRPSGVLTYSPEQGELYKVTRNYLMGSFSGRGIQIES